MKLKYIRAKKPKIVIETNEETKKQFTEKARSEGYTMSGLILKWIRDFLSGKK